MKHCDCWDDFGGIFGGLGDGRYHLRANLGMCKASKTKPDSELNQSDSALDIKPLSAPAEITRVVVIIFQQIK
jgi:hypothetical protein